MQCHSPMGNAKPIIALRITCQCKSDERKGKSTWQVLQEKVGEGYSSSPSQLQSHNLTRLGQYCLCSSPLTFRWILALLPKAATASAASIRGGNLSASLLWFSEPPCCRFPRESSRETQWRRSCGIARGFKRDTAGISTDWGNGSCRGST